jgi:hypothetical protein
LQRRISKKKNKRILFSFCKITQNSIADLISLQKIMNFKKDISKKSKEKSTFSQLQLKVVQNKKEKCATNLHVRFSI